MNTVKQIYENAGTMMRSDRTYEKVRENIERLVMREKLFKWNGKATKEFIDMIFIMGKEVTDDDKSQSISKEDK